jgi:acetylornithine/succinyldiaminopimelate/putrescine aminotransferase
MNSESFLDGHLAQTTLHPLGLRIQSAQGIDLVLEGGRKIMDLISGIGPSAWGHSHPFILAALHAQIDAHLHTMVYGEFHQRSQDEAARLLVDFLPDSLDTVYFVNSGAEAIEGALKLAKRITKRQGLLACNGAYHGNTHGALSVSANAERKAPFEPLLPQVSFMPFNDMEGLDAIDDSHAAVIVETVQGDAGIRIPSRAWMQALRERCDAKGTLLILDEVQAGMGRTGKVFAFEHFGIVPDILCLGKALGAGLPIGAFVASRERMRLLADGPSLGHITTFGGHPVPCAAAAAGLRLMQQVDWEAVERAGARLERFLLAHPAVREVRRIGLYVAVELSGPEAVTRCIEAGLEAGVLLFWFLSTPQAFRMAPPLNMTDGDWDRVWPALKTALDAAC